MAGDRTGRGEGLLGVVRAFMAAGASRVLANLWAADDKSTAMLMERFHAERERGRSDLEALRAAQDVVRAHRDERGQAHWAAPYYWAGWVPWGLPDAPR